MASLDLDIYKYTLLVHVKPVPVQSDREARSRWSEIFAKPAGSPVTAAVYGLNDMALAIVLDHMEPIYLCLLCV